MTKKPNKECAETYYNRGLAHSKKGELERAIADYTKAIELKPDYADAYYSRGGTFLRLGEREKAEVDLATARNMGADAITALDKILQDHDRAWKVLGNS
ncbi:MAG: tetratricopeptide repeat protein [Candidatus Poribacteria bacterium]|nr:tetratricopeptide repeat protein [Candidatus Poribacteria bacterium]